MTKLTDQATLSILVECTAAGEVAERREEARSGEAVVELMAFSSVMASASQSNGITIPALPYRRHALPIIVDCISNHFRSAH